jgi:hypothetical protein
MPLDEAAGGCLWTIFRIVLEACPEGCLRFFWGICQYTGAALVWLCTFGQDWPLDEREDLAGTAGLMAHILLIWWLFRIF